MSDNNPTPSIDFNQVLTNLGNLGTQLLDSLTNGLLSHVTDPQDLDIITRATTTLATLPVTIIGADDVAKAEAKSSYDTAMTVLYSYASAEEEDVAGIETQAQVKLRTFINDFLSTAIKASLMALMAA